MSKTLKISSYFIIIFLLTAFNLFHQKKLSYSISSASIKIIFINTVKGNKIVLGDSMYRNPFNEKYTITKLRYYITNIILKKGHIFFEEKNSFHLIDESKKESQTINISVSESNFSGLQFLLGVDSLHNISGAQTDNLDPANDMFWTWNSGYVMAKMEGNSPESKLVNNKYEFHIGGFSGPFNVLKKISLPLNIDKLKLNAGRHYTIVINADINAWWQNPHDIKIADHANITSPGINAKNISDNYANMFHIEKIIAE